MSNSKLEHKYNDKEAVLNMSEYEHLLTLYYLLFFIFQTQKDVILRLFKEFE